MFSVEFYVLTCSALCFNNLVTVESKVCNNLLIVSVCTGERDVIELSQHIEHIRNPDHQRQENDIVIPETTTSRPKKESAKLGLPLTEIIFKPIFRAIFNATDIKNKLRKRKKTKDVSDEASNHCAMGHHQSPIDITSSHLVQNVSMYLKLKDYHNQVFPVMLHNNGHSVELSISDEIRPVISGPAVDNKVYQLHDVHFHWKSGSIGSEHFVNGKQYAAEIHFVHYNAAYGSFRAAKSHPDGLAVLSSFIEISSKTNRKLDPVISGLTEVDKIGSESVLKEPLNLLNLISRDLKVFYRYKGSLTTHPCTESVTWIVFPVPIRISGDQFDHFHKIKQYEQHHTQGNVRRLQPINGRKIESSYIALSGSRN